MFARQAAFHCWRGEEESGRGVDIIVFAEFIPPTKDYITPSPSLPSPFSGAVLEGYSSGIVPDRRLTSPREFHALKGGHFAQGLSTPFLSPLSSFLSSHHFALYISFSFLNCCIVCCYFIL